jgi:diguanylate cyclase (GGDEF)-like protein
VNDSLGHHAGDELLRDVSTRLRTAVRQADLVARQGGDEFLVLLDDLEDATDPVTTARAVAARIHEALRPPFTLSGTPFYISVSIGISLFPQSAQDSNDLLRRADAAMYLSKRTNPGGTMLSSPEAEDRLGRLSFATRLREAVDASAWTLHYQPLVRLAGGDWVGVEALIRLADGDEHLVPPDEFVPLAEEMGLMGAIGGWVIDELCRQAREWREAGTDVGFVSFNLSPQQLWQPDLAERLIGSVESAGLDPSHVMVEMSESATVAEPARATRVLEELHDRGLRLAIDDFGTGVSSIARLRDLPIDIVKIDRPFLRGVPDDEEAAAVLSAMVELIRSLGMEPLAEGVETDGQRRFLIERGCVLGQGFLFAAPVPASELASLRSTS